MPKKPEDIELQPLSFRDSVAQRMREMADSLASGQRSVWWTAALMHQEQLRLFQSLDSDDMVKFLRAVFGGNPPDGAILYKIVEQEQAKKK